MVKDFICVTQVSRMNTYSGPSGFNYESKKGRPFRVSDSRDIAHFDRLDVFKEWSKTKDVVLQEEIQLSNDVEGVEVDSGDAEKDLIEYLEGILVSDAGIKKILHIFDNKAVLKENILDGRDLRSELRLSKKDWDLILKYMVN